MIHQHYVFEGVSCANSVGITFDDNSVLNACQNNHIDALNANGIEIPIAVTELLMELIEMMRNMFPKLSSREERSECVANLRQ